MEISLHSFIHSPFVHLFIQSIFSSYHFHFDFDRKFWCLSLISVIHLETLFHCLLQCSIKRKSLLTQDHHKFVPISSVHHHCSFQRGPVGANTTPITAAAARAVKLVRTKQRSCNLCGKLLTIALVTHIWSLDLCPLRVCTLVKFWFMKFSNTFTANMPLKRPYDRLASSLPPNNMSCILQGYWVRSIVYEYEVSCRSNTTTLWYGMCIVKVNWY